MSKIGLLGVDSRNYPNIALGKIARYYRERGDHVEWYDGISEYDAVYMSKVFTFTPSWGEYINADVVYYGGTGITERDGRLGRANERWEVLPGEVDKLQPLWDIYPRMMVDNRTAYGFTTRGCCNNCPWCVVPSKEGNVRGYQTVEEISEGGRRSNLVLMDNNVLASDWGLEQMEEIIRRKFRVDYNQGLDAGMVDKDIAGLLARVRWKDSYMRFAADTGARVGVVRRAMEMLREAGYKGYFFIYCLLRGEGEEARKECEGRLMSFWGDKKIRVFAQAYRPLDNMVHIIPQWQRDMMRWANRREFWAVVKFKDYKYNGKDKR